MQFLIIGGVNLTLQVNLTYLWWNIELLVHFLRYWFDVCDSFSSIQLLLDKCRNTTDKK